LLLQMEIVTFVHNLVLLHTYLWRNTQ
jgi:hypothetical protein